MKKGLEESELKIRVYMEYDYLTTIDACKVFESIRKPITTRKGWHPDVFRIKSMRTEKSWECELVASLEEITKIIVVSRTIDWTFEKTVNWLRDNLIPAIKRRFEESPIPIRDYINKTSFGISVNEEEIETLRYEKDEDNILREIES